MKEQDREGNLAICVIWVGHSLNSSVKVHRKILEQLEVQKPADSEIDQSEFTQVYEITFFGEPICINEYMKHIALPPTVRVI